MHAAMLIYSTNRAAPAVRDQWPLVTLDSLLRRVDQVEWTPELHAIFAAAVEKVGVDRAVPSQILADMGTAGRGLTRQNIASHLQKHRARCLLCAFGALARTRAG